MNDTELNLAIGHGLGWVTYPSDSVEGGTVFHCDPDKAPLGKILDVCEFNPTNNWNDLMPLIIEYGLYYTRDTCRFHARSYYDESCKVSHPFLQRALAECLLKVLKNKQLTAPQGKGPK